jgi:hypothetical protein
MTVFLLNGWHHTRVEHRNGRVTLRASTRREIAEANANREVICGHDCIPPSACGKCHVLPIDEDFRRLEALLDAGASVDQLQSIVWSCRKLDERLCARYSWWAERSAEHRQHFDDAEALWSLVQLRRRLRRDPAKAGELGVTLEELDGLITQGRERFYEYEERMGWAEPDGEARKRALS